MAMMAAAAVMLWITVGGALEMASGAWELRFTISTGSDVGLSDDWKPLILRKETSFYILWDHEKYSLFKSH